MTSRHRIAVLFAALAAFMGLSACGQREATGVGQPAAPAEAREIAWFAGSVEDAFAEAQAASRPVFLFWGAAWCPYCQQLKSSVFTRRDFIEKSRLFVSVYLGGDEPGAQK